MKKLLFLFLFTICWCSCIKKRAIKYDPDLAGTWVGTFDNNYYWLKVNADGNGTYRNYNGGFKDELKTGQVKYSLFELRMWVGNKKFKVKEWLTADMKDVFEVMAKDYETLADTKYQVDRRMVLKNTVFDSGKFITLYRIKQ
ncbi:MAG: hypothetical protein Q7W45_01300 [Bacteroidota bacterium]|nr:hypothetical protein [Bacteroidota bacterium]MDP3146514.1 hypothetical protein [Bacteroidota bacterium]